MYAATRIICSSFRTVFGQPDSVVRDRKLDFLSHSTRLRNWTTTPHCPWTEGPFNKLSQEDKWQSAINLVSGCKFCQTDFSLAMVSLPPSPAGYQGGGTETNICVMTSWKDLGTGLSIKDIKWQSHLCRNRGENQGGANGEFRRDAETWGVDEFQSARIAREYEMGRGTVTESLRTSTFYPFYHPRISEELLRNLVSHEEIPETSG